jgi:hypothetical protein
MSNQLTDEQFDAIVPRLLEDRKELLARLADLTLAQFCTIIERQDDARSKPTAKPWTWYVITRVTVQPIYGEPPVTERDAEVVMSSHLSNAKTTYTVEISGGGEKYAIPTDQAQDSHYEI